MTKIRGTADRLSRIRSRMANHWPEVIGFAAVLALATFLRFYNLQARGLWDRDQGSIMLALWNSIQTGAIPQLGQAASTGTFHHGALYNDLMLPGAWIGGGGPTWVLAETALAGLAVIPMVWWVARSIGGPAAGLTAALLAATSGGMVDFSTFIWNPTVIEPGAALALLGAWQAWSRRNPAWLLAVGAGTAVAMQAHIAAAVLILPMTAVFVALLRRGPVGQRRRIALWGLGAVALILATYVPLFVYEAGHDFAETRAMIAFFFGPGQHATTSPVRRLLFGGGRILSWPLIGWPVWGKDSGFRLAAGFASVLSAGLAWRLVATGWPILRRARGSSENSSPSIELPIISADVQARQREGTWLVACCLGVIILVLGLGLSDVSKIRPYLIEQYHIVADPFVIVIAALVLGALWNLAGRVGWLKWFGRLVCAVALVALTYNNSGQWRMGANVSNWSLAQSVGDRIQTDAAGRSVALVGLPHYGSTDADALTYPLVLDGASPVEPDRASVLVTICTTSHAACGGPAETAWLATQPKASGYLLVDRFAAADLTISVYGPGSN